MLRLITLLKWSVDDKENTASSVTFEAEGPLKKRRIKTYLKRNDSDNEVSAKDMNDDYDIAYTGTRY